MESNGNNGSLKDSSWSLSPFKRSSISFALLVSSINEADKFFCSAENDSYFSLNFMFAILIIEIAVSISSNPNKSSIYHSILPPSISNIFTSLSEQKNALQSNSSIIPPKGFRKSDSLYEEQVHNTAFNSSLDFIFCKKSCNNPVSIYCRLIATDTSPNVNSSMALYNDVLPLPFAPNITIEIGFIVSFALYFPNVSP